jgi:riboflavin kinase / FMN adenylyltransferase
MKIFRNFKDTAVIINPVVTTGSFDGVHIGHKVILNRLKMLAGKYNGESVLITFDPHPRKVLYPETAGKDLKLINSQEEKLDLLSKAGLDNVIIIEFTREFSKITSEQFVCDFLHELLKARVVVAGFNHHFGFNKEGDYRQLWAWQSKYNFEAEEIPEQEVQHETVSSTKIREAISSGYIQRANAYLDHYYMVKGTLNDHDTGFQGQLPVFSEIPLTEECKLLPSPGIYAVSVEKPGFYTKGMAIIHINVEERKEVLLNCFGDSSFIPGENVTVYFHKKIHGSVNLFDSQSIVWVRHAMEEISDLIY